MAIYLCGSSAEQALVVRQASDGAEIIQIADAAELQSQPVRGKNIAILCGSGSASGLRDDICALRQKLHRMPVVVILEAAGGLDIASLIRAGAEYVLSSADSAELKTVLDELEQAAVERCTQEEFEPWRELLVGDSWQMKVIGHMIRLVAARTATVLITGESGTGKEVVARALHSASKRARGPMVCLNCAALPQDLMEAELFGHVKGAFTGAIANRVGLIEQANQGTLFLDEIGEMPLNLQAKLLRVLQEREFQRLGSGETVKVDIRVIAATNVDLPRRVREGKFREDLYYRLRVVPIQLPPMRDRKDDIPLLVDHFINKTCHIEGLAPKTITAEALRSLIEHDWPGNVRELENAIAMAVALSGESDRLEIWNFPTLTTPQQLDVIPCILPPNGIDYEKAVTLFRKALLEQAMRTTGWNKSQAAQLLGLKRTTLTATLKSLNLCRDDETEADEVSVALLAS